MWVLTSLLQLWFYWLRGLIQFQYLSWNVDYYLGYQEICCFYVTLCFICSKKPTTEPRLEPDESTSYLHTLFSKFCFNIILPSLAASPKFSLYLRLCDWSCICVFHFRHDCYMSSNLTLFHSITLSVRHQEHKLWSFLLYRFLQSFYFIQISFSTLL